MVEFTSVKGIRKIYMQESKRIEKKKKKKKTYY